MALLSKFKTVLPVTYTDEYKELKANGTLIHIPIHRIRANPSQPRRSFDDDSLSELSESIKRYGIIQPITVRQLSPTEYELVAGERRLRACSLAGLLKIPAIVTGISDTDSAVVALIENIQRENLSFMEEAEGYKNLLCSHGFTQEDLAKKIGKTQSFIANKVRLLKLSRLVRDIIKENSLTERHARALLRFDDEEMQIKALSKITADNLNVAQTDELVEQMLSENKEESEKSPFENCTIRFKDVRVFANTVRHAVDIMRKNGIDANAQENEFDAYYEYIIHIPKS